MGCMYLFELEFLFSSGKNSEVKFLDPMVDSWGCKESDTTERLN